MLRDFCYSYPSRTLFGRGIYRSLEATRVRIDSRDFRGRCHRFDQRMLDGSGSVRAARR
jgi:hypothetical protein